MVFRQNYVIYMELRFVAIRSFGDFVKGTTGSLSKRKNLTTECTGNTEGYVSAYSQCTPPSTDIVPIPSTREGRRLWLKIKL
jgi:hypothetical protein